MKKLTSIFQQKKTWTTVLVIVAISIILGIITSSSLRKEDAKTSANKPGKTISTDLAKKTAEDFINNFLMQSGSKATIKNITTEYGLYKLSVDITSDVVDSYMTKDGKLFFPQALNVAEVTAAKAGTAAAGSDTAAAATPSATVTKKSDKPVIELFVMSYCPYGTQIEKGILPVLSTLGSKINFQLKFCSYAMHGEKELTENLLQYCIQKEQPAKLNTYLTCFLADSSQSATCLDKAGINKNTVNSCVTKTDKDFKVMANFTSKTGYQGSYPGFDVQKADNDKYSVGGSPTLIINGQDIQSGRDSASLLATICSAFNTPPAECSTKLSSASPSAGFGTGTAAASGAAAGCGQ
ncbi:MAG: hypothetical protein WCN88_02390 [Candidatus Falkowbacteria bacterium]